MLTARIQIRRGGSTANDACTSPGAAGAGLYNRAHATLQGTPAHVDFEANACRNTPTPVWVTLNKDLQGRVVADDQVEIRLHSGGTPAATAVTTGNAATASATTGLVVVPAGRVMQFTESLRTAGSGPRRPLTGYQAQAAIRRFKDSDCCRSPAISESGRLDRSMLTMLISTEN